MEVFQQKHSCLSQPALNLCMWRSDSFGWYLSVWALRLLHLSLCNFGLLGKWKSSPDPVEGRGGSELAPWTPRQISHRLQ